MRSSAARSRRPAMPWSTAGRRAPSRPRSASPGADRTARSIPAWRRRCRAPAPGRTIPRSCRPACPPPPAAMSGPGHDRPHIISHIFGLPKLGRHHEERVEQAARAARRDRLWRSESEGHRAAGLGGLQPEVTAAGRRRMTVDPRRRPGRRSRPIVGPSRWTGPSACDEGPVFFLRRPVQLGRGPLGLGPMDRDKARVTDRSRRHAPTRPRGMPDGERRWRAGRIRDGRG